MLSSQRKLDNVQSVVNAAGCSPVSRCSQIRPRDTAPDGPSLAADTTCQCSCRPNGAAPRYLTELATPVGSTAHCHLRSASSADLVVPATRWSTIGNRAFAIAGQRAWNSLHPAVRSSATYNIFKKDLKSHFYGLSFALWQLCILTIVQRSCSSLYRLPRFINCPTYITLHYFNI